MRLGGQVKELKGCLIFGSGESEEISLVSKSAACQNYAVLFLCRNFSLENFD